MLIPGPTSAAAPPNRRRPTAEGRRPTANGQKANGQKANGQKANGQKANGQKANGQKANGQKANGQKANGQRPTATTYDKRATPDGRRATSHQDSSE
jgi:hypothetical protein